MLYRNYYVKNVGSNNAVVFKNGSVLKIDHYGALSPFGTSAPISKVVFEPQSSLIILSIGSLQLSGRSLSNLVVEAGVNLNLSESFSSDITIEGITVKQNASVNITNTNSSYTPKFNVHGSMIINGEFNFEHSAAGKFDFRLNGNAPQSISGAGQFTLPANLESFTIDNDIELHRNIQVNCRFQHLSGSINNNGFYLFTGGKNPGLHLDINPDSPAVTENTVAENLLPKEYSISQNYPNPFNSSTKINFSVPYTSNVKIIVFDITGKEVTTLINKQFEAGNHTVNFDSKDLSSGVYFYNITSGSFSKTMKMILSK